MWRNSLIIAVVAAGLGLAHSASGARCPNLAVALDRSGSMQSKPDNTATTDPMQMKWYFAQQALSAVLTKYDGLLPIGLEMFPADNLCAIPTGFDVAPAYRTKAKIEMAYTAATALPNGSTPTCQAIDTLRLQMVMKDATRAQYILLITDGIPNCGCGNGTEDQTAIDATVLAIKNARNANPPIKTFVVGFGITAMNKAALNSMADAGGVPSSDPTNHFYSAQSYAQLLDALMKIVGQIVESNGVTCNDDESCYSDKACAVGKLCLNGSCVNDPCATKMCGTGEYCWTDGTSMPICKKPCPTCTGGQVCRDGMCVNLPCGGSCPSGQTCVAGLCKQDGACKAVTCRGPQKCQGGKCVDDPCLFVKCPPQTRCIDGGSCEIYALAGPMGPPSDVIFEPGGGENGTISGGCNMSARRDGAVWGATTLFVLALLAAARRRRSGGSVA